MPGLPCCIPLSFLRRTQRRTQGAALLQGAAHLPVHIHEAHADRVYRMVLPVLRVQHPPEGKARQALEVLQVLAAVDINDGLVRVQQRLRRLGLIDKKPPGMWEPINFTKGMVCSLSSKRLSGMAGSSDLCFTFFRLFCFRPREQSWKRLAFP